MGWVPGDPGGAHPAALGGWARQGGCGRGRRAKEAGLRSYPNVNLSTLLSTSVDWSSCASGWRMDTRTLLTVAWWVLCRAQRTEMAMAVTLVTSRPSTGWGPGRQGGCSSGGRQELETTDGAQEG